MWRPSACLSAQECELLIYLLVFGFVRVCCCWHRQFHFFGCFAVAAVCSLSAFAAWNFRDVNHRQTRTGSDFVCASSLKFAGELALFRNHTWTTLTHTHTCAAHGTQEERKKTIALAKNQSVECEKLYLSRSHKWPKMH